MSVAYWRFFVNALLVFCDMASFILAAVVVLMTQSEINLYSSRFHFHINLWAYVVVCALVWVFCLHSVGMYHRHVMGDGYQLNMLLFKKRVFDIVVSLIALIGTAIITIPVAIAIKVTDGGPIFYTQTRVGRRGKTFKMIKFRSMVVNTDKMKAELAKQTGQTDRFIFKMKDDPRVTAVGKFIRKFSIDEFPQFLNVLRGDMSVVGPRPPLPEEVAQYNQTYATRMLVKPGITGPWQVSGRSNLSEEESEALDVTYVQNWSMLGDVVLLFRTVGAMLSHKGAY